MRRIACADSSHMNVGIKYCGGCDPAFDRVEMAERIQTAADSSITWCSATEKENDAILLICGCEKACPLGELEGTSRAVVLTRADTPIQMLLHKILNKGNTDENKDER